MGNDQPRLVYPPVTEEDQIEIQRPRFPAGMNRRPTGFPFEALAELKQLPGPAGPLPGKRPIAEIRSPGHTIHRRRPEDPAHSEIFHSAGGQSGRSFLEDSCRISEIAAHHDRNFLFF